MERLPLLLKTVFTGLWQDVDVGHDPEQGGDSTQGAHDAEVHWQAQVEGGQSGDRDSHGKYHYVFNKRM